MRKNEKPRALTQEEKDAMPMRNDAIDKLRNTDSTGYWQMPNESDKYKKREPSKSTAELQQKAATEAAKKAPSKSTGYWQMPNESDKYKKREPSKN